MAKPEEAIITEENYEGSYYVFEERQAGVSLVFSPGEERYYYHAYCMDQKILKEVFSVEFEFLQDAIETINLEFGNWTLKILIRRKKIAALVSLNNYRRPVSFAAKSVSKSRMNFFGLQAWPLTQIS